MFESQGTTPEVAQDVITQDMYDAVQSQVAQLMAEATMIRNQRDSYIDHYNKARKFIQDSIDREDWTDSELEEPFWTELAELMDLTINRTIEVEVTVTFTGTMTLPVGTSPEDFSDWDWSAELEHNNHASDFEVYDVKTRER